MTSTPITTARGKLARLQMTVTLPAATKRGDIRKRHTLLGRVTPLAAAKAAATAMRRSKIALSVAVYPLDYPAQDPRSTCVVSLFRDPTTGDLYDVQSGRDVDAALAALARQLRSEA